MKIARFIASLVFAVALVTTSSYGGTPVTLQQATATFSQTSGDFSVSRAINGTTDDALGWAILPDIKAQTALSDLEVKHINITQKIYFVKYDLVDKIQNIPGKN